MGLRRWFFGTIRPEAVETHSVSTENATTTAWKEIDMVERGADNTGTNDVASLVKSEAENDAALIFPDGTYQFDSRLDFTTGDLSSIERLKIVGKGDVTFNAPTDGATESLILTPSAGVERLEIENVTFDTQGTYRFATLRVTECGLVKDCDIVTEMTAGDSGGLRVDAVSSDAHVDVVKLRATDGSQNVNGQGGSPTGILLDSHVGSARFRDCVIKNWFDNGLYNAGTGKIIVDGGRYENNGNNNVRSHGSGSIVRGVTIIIDDSNLSAAEAIRFEDGSGHLAEGCQITMRNGGNAAVNVGSSCGTVTLQELDILLDNNDSRGVARFQEYTGGDDVERVSMVDCNVEGVHDGGIGQAIQSQRNVSIRGCDFNVTSTAGSSLSQLILLQDTDVQTLVDNKIESDVMCVQTFEMNRAIVNGNRMTNTAGNDEVSAGTASNSVFIGNIVDNGINSDASAETAANKTLP